MKNSPIAKIAAWLEEILRAKRIPFVPQTTLNDCGAASLAMVLGYFGREVRLETVRGAMGVGRGGVTARTILETAALFDLQGRGVQVDLPELECLPMGAILHWNLKHFVVLEEVAGDDVVIVDPAFGRRVLPMADVSKSFSGIALIFEPGDGFQPEASKDRPLRRHMARAFRQSNDWGRIVIVSVLMQLATVALPLITGRLIDRVVPRGDYVLLALLASGFVFILFFHFATQMVRARLLLHLRTRIDATMTLGFLEHMLRLPYAFFQSRQPADLLIRINSISTIRDVLTTSLLSAMLDGTMVVGYLLLLLVISPKLAIAAVFVVTAQSSTYLATRRRLRELAAANLAKQAEASSYLTDVLSGIESLKAIGSEIRASQHWAGLYVDLLNNNLERGTTSAWSESMLGTVRVVSPIVLLLVGIVQVVKGEMSLGTMITANAFAFAFVAPVSNLIGNFASLQFVTMQLTRVEDVLSTPPEQHDGPPRELQVAPRLTGRIELRNVSFRYAPALPMVVKNVSLVIEPGQVIGLVGPSGSGKSTLASLLLGLYEPTEGDLFYDGINLKDLDVRSVRRQLGVVVQRPYIFGTTIRSNIALADPDVPLDQVRAAARLACVDADIDALARGYETVVAGGGGSLSGGQRQRIALARALVAEPAILLLDEATSALDSVTESRVQKNLDGLGCTRLIVAHRLSTVVHASTILVIKDGAVAESGSHDELLARRGIYRDLVSAQKPATRRPQPPAPPSRSAPVSVPSLPVRTGAAKIGSADDRHPNAAGSLPL